MKRNLIFQVITFLLLLSGAVFAGCGPNTTTSTSTVENKSNQAFDGDRAMQDVQAQMAFGPRTPDSQANQQALQWILAQAKAAGWQVELQQATRMGHPVQNVIAKRGVGKPWIILGAHYDSRMSADKDPDPTRRTQPVPGANDGASGVAVLLELARALPVQLNNEIWLVFIDSEDQGDLPGWDWILGSQTFADSLSDKPDAVIIVDMIGDANLNIFEEQNSNKTLTQEIWYTAAQAGFHQFIPQPKYSMIDDHTPFLQKGIPAVDIIDFDYPEWHTTADTADKVSPKSLEAVGETLRQWLLEKSTGN